MSSAKKLAARMHERVDGSGLALFRIAFGMVMAFSLVRFMSSGFVEEFYGKPSFFFQYWGFEWVRPLPIWAMYGLYISLTILALGIAAGFLYRACAALFFVGFSYAQLIDVTNYLNHYYLAAMIALLMAVAPLHSTLAVDARRMAPAIRNSVPRWALYLFRLQIGAVYIFAGLAKFNSDWLLHAQPLGLWLSSRTEMPLVGPWLDETVVAYGMSWAGFLFDTTIVVWLSLRRTRPYAFVVLVLFHIATRLLFNIGMFPFIMVTCATVFFDPAWPRRFLRKLPALSLQATAPHYSAQRRIGLALFSAFALFVTLMPLRHFVYQGDVLWGEEGMRFSWKVMVREKHGSVTFFVRSKETGRELQVSPRRYLNARQEREMSAQPDLILQLAQHIARDFQRKGYGAVEVRAEALVSLNGRPAQHMIDPNVDLAVQSDGIAPKRWITRDPDTAPIHLRARAGL